MMNNFLKDLIKIAVICTIVSAGLIIITDNKSKAADIMSPIVTKENDNMYLLEFQKFDVLYDCNHLGYELFFFNLDKDVGSEKRVKQFHTETSLPASCRAKDLYKDYLKYSEDTYDRGHGVDSNAMDDSINSMTDTNSLANVAPQDSDLNRHGIWRKMEKVVNCYRNNEKVFIVGGAFYSSDKKELLEVGLSDIPTYFWKTMYLLASKKSLTILVPNTNEAGTDLDIKKYITNTKDISMKIKNPDVQKKLHEITGSYSFTDIQDPNIFNIPKNCDRG